MNYVKKYAVLTGFCLSVLLLLIATTQYPGGSLSDKNSIGFQWTKNFISNLFADKAVNGSDNPARIWADAGMIFLSVSFALFFIRFSKKIPSRSTARVVSILGIAGMVCTFLIITSLHDLMIGLSSTLFLICIFYITVFIFKSKLHFFKFLCAICLIIFYYTLFLYGSGRYTLLPVMQKVTFISTILLVVSLEYFTEKKDFEHIQTGRKHPVQN